MRSRIAEAPQRRVAFAGCGRIAATHLAALRACRGVRLVGVADPVRDRADSLGRRAGVAAFERLADLLAEAHPEVVHVLTPPHTHARVAIEALESGAHVLVEKPLATSAADAARIVRAASAAGRVVCVDHNRLFDPVVARARALVGGGVIGDVCLVEAYQGYRPGEVRGDNEAPGLAAFFDLAPHPLYLARAFAGPLAEVRGLGGDPEAGELRFLVEGQRAPAFVVFSVRLRPFLSRLNVYGTRGTLRLDLAAMTLVHERAERGGDFIHRSLAALGGAGQIAIGVGRNLAATALGRLRRYPGMRALILRFYRALEDRQPPPVDGRAGSEVASLLETLAGGGRAHGDTAAPRINHPPFGGDGGEARGG